VLSSRVSPWLRPLTFHPSTSINDTEYERQKTIFLAQRHDRIKKDTAPPATH
jgi:hypothetical protein